MASWCYKKELRGCTKLEDFFFGGGIGTPVAEKVFRHLVVEPKSKTDSVSISLPIFFVSAPIPIFFGENFESDNFFSEVFFRCCEFRFSVSEVRSQDAEVLLQETEGRLQGTL